MGDGRLKLTDAADGSQDVIVLDAFSSDAIPVHLLTREAIELYLRKLRPDGLLLFHITNGHLDLAPVLSAAAAKLDLVGSQRLDERLTHAERREGRTESRRVVLARNSRDVDLLVRQRGWQPLPEPAARVWTDDFSNILSVMEFI